MVLKIILFQSQYLIEKSQIKTATNVFMTISFVSKILRADIIFTGATSLNTSFTQFELNVRIQSHHRTSHKKRIYLKRLLFTSFAHFERYFTIYSRHPPPHHERKVLSRLLCTSNPHFRTKRYHSYASSNIISQKNIPQDTCVHLRRSPRIKRCHSLSQSNIQ